MDANTIVIPSEFHLNIMLTVGIIDGALSSFSEYALFVFIVLFAGSVSHLSLDQVQQVASGSTSGNPGSEL